MWNPSTFLLVFNALFSILTLVSPSGGLNLKQNIPQINNLKLKTADLNPDPDLEETDMQSFRDLCNGKVLMVSKRDLVS